MLSILLFSLYFIALNHSQRPETYLAQLKALKHAQLTGRSIKTPIGITEAMSVKVLLSVIFSFSVNSSLIKILLSKPIAAPVSIARSWVPCQISCLLSSRRQNSDVRGKKQLYLKNSYTDEFICKTDVWFPRKKSLKTKSYCSCFL